VKALSGGERNRLLLARLFTRPANVLVLDEPTNDLDLETLELLEAELVDWPGTLLLVSHDRAFLDNVVTSTFVFEGDGRVQEYVGGYEDWLRQRAQSSPPQRTRRTQRRDASEDQESSSASSVSSAVESSTASTKALAERKKLSYNEQRELDALPARIESLESEQSALNARIAGPDFYKDAPHDIHAALARIGASARPERRVFPMGQSWTRGQVAETFFHEGTKRQRRTRSFLEQSHSS
jgi:ATP-binding cassette subfamily F protein uup